MLRSRLDVCSQRPCCMTTERQLFGGGDGGGASHITPATSSPHDSNPGILTPLAPDDAASDIWQALYRGGGGGGGKGKKGGGGGGSGGGRAWQISPATSTNASYPLISLGK